MSNIEDRDLVSRRLWDWEFLNQCFQGKVRLSDVDGIVEYRGHVLMIEGAGTGREYEDARKWVFQAMVARDVTVILLYGNPEVDPPVVTHVQQYGVDDRPVRLTRGDFVAAVKRWAQQAEQCQLDGHLACKTAEKIDLFSQRFNFR